MPGPEFLQVESPLLTQLEKMGWTVTWGNPDERKKLIPSFPGDSLRESFREVLLLADLHAAMHRINLRDGQPWLDQGRLNQATNALMRLNGGLRLLEANTEATDLLLRGAEVDGLPDWDNGRGKTAKFIDFDHPENNTFRVVNQFRVDVPGGQAGKCIIPDAVLFVNGIPLVVIECKHGEAEQVLAEAVNQLQRYSNQREDVGDAEGNELLFRFNQFLVATCGDRARVGTFTSKAVHYQEWKDTSPVSQAQVALELGKAGKQLTGQETLVAGMLRPVHLLDIMRHFVILMEANGQKVRNVCRYQQFRAVHAAIARLKTGKTRLQDGTDDRRGGIVWHTQGSGKSLTMVFLVRALRSDPVLRSFKVVVVTDRTQLQEQLVETASLTGEPVSVASDASELREMLAREGASLDFAMIQKYRGDEADEDGDEAPAGAVAGRVGWNSAAMAAETPDEAQAYRIDGLYKDLNTSEKIVVLVDEAHRSHGSTLHANLLNALPNCAKIGFTGTPIIMGSKKKTERIFGGLIDRYSIRQAQEDGATVPILYEGRMARGDVAGDKSLDELLPQLFPEYSEEEREKIRKKYVTKSQVLEAPELIRLKAGDMLRHYVENILPNGFKAQVVAVSRRAALRYHEAFLAVRTELVEKLEALDPALLARAPEELTGDDAFLVRAHRFLEVLRAIEFAPVISGSHNDEPAYKEWSDKSKVKVRLKRFTKPLFHDKPEKRDPLAFLIVKSMLLTGFDAPVEQVMYLDRHIKEAELLQAIARVNRTCGERKQVGLVVDYFGVADRLRDALKEYDATDLEGMLANVADEVPLLRDRLLRAKHVFTERGVEVKDTEGCVELLRDEALRAAFQVHLKAFLSTLDTVLPRPEALPFTKDAKQLSLIQAKSHNLYRGSERLIGREVGEKVRKLIDDHIEAQGIDPKIPPVAITSANFAEAVEGHVSPRAKASEMEHALRWHIRKNFDEDPERYQTLSQKLEEILRELEGRWADMLTALDSLIDEAKAGRQEDETGLDPATELPFFALVRQAQGGTPAPETVAKLTDLTREWVAHIRQEVSLVHFWSRPEMQAQLRKWVIRQLDDHNVLPFEQCGELAGRILELAKANHHRLAN